MPDIGGAAEVVPALKLNRASANRFWESITTQSDLKHRLYHCTLVWSLPEVEHLFYSLLKIELGDT